MAGLHHIEVWLRENTAAWAQWSWMLGALGYQLTDEWSGGQLWSVPGSAGTYISLTTSPNFSPESFDRRRGGVNHLAFTVESSQSADAIMAGASAHGWEPLYHERYPHAGGPEHYAGWVENSDGFKIEIVAPL